MKIIESTIESLKLEIEKAKSAGILFLEIQSNGHINGMLDYINSNISDFEYFNITNRYFTNIFKLEIKFNKSTK